MGRYRYKHCGIPLKIFLLFTNLMVLSAISFGIYIFIIMFQNLDDLTDVGPWDIVSMTMETIGLFFATLLMVLVLIQITAMNFIRLRQPIVVKERTIKMPYYIFRAGDEIMNEYPLKDIELIDGSDSRRKREILSFLHSNKFENNHVNAGWIETRYLNDPSRFLFIRVEDIYYHFEKDRIDDLQGMIHEIELKIF